MKDVLQHWTLDNIYIFLDYVTDHKIFKYILICNCSNQTHDNPTNSNGAFAQLSCKYLPLKKYNPTKYLNYNSKEVSIIEIN